jgi:hypothetical protein
MTQIPLDDETRWILGRPNFICGPIARDLRRAGHQIDEKAEDEQAAVILWMLNLYLKHGRAWRNKATEFFAQLEDCRT